jgi:hypothetical protein
VEAQFYFRVAVNGITETLALCSLYSPVDENLSNYTYGALTVSNYEGEGNLVVIRIDSILSAVAMVPFGEPTERRFSLVEKFAFGVIHTGDTVD